MVHPKWSTALQQKCSNVQVKHKAIDTQRQICSFERWEGSLYPHSGQFWRPHRKDPQANPTQLCLCRLVMMLCDICVSHQLIWLFHDPNEAMPSQNAGISNLRLSYVTPARMSIKNLTALEVSFHKALLDCAQEGEKSDSCAKTIRANNLHQLSPTD